MAEIARKVGVTKPTAWAWFQKSIPSLDTIQRIAAVYSVNLTWLLSGEGDKYPAHLTVREAHAGYPAGKADEFLRVPCVVVAMAGEPYIQPEHLDPQAKDGYYFKKSTLNRWDSATTREGKWITARLDKKAESMVPTLQPGGVILVNRRVSKFIQSPATIDGKVFLVNLDDGVVAKRLYIDDRILQLASDNKPFRPKHVDLRRFDLTKFLIGHIIWHGAEVK